jgi:hypothetical protein
VQVRNLEVPNMSTSTLVKSFDTVCDALRDVHDEASLWRLSDELVKIAPSGVASVDEVVAQAKLRGIPTKSTNTLRLYRDVAIRFPASERVPLVTFSAHREAIAIGDVKKARAVLEELVKRHGPAGVTVTTVKQAIGAATGNVKPAKAQVVASKGYAEVAADLSKGGKKFIAALDSIVGVDGVTLDGLHAGLSAVLTQVEVLRSKAARKAQAAKVAPKNGTVVDPKKSPAARKAIAAARNGKPTPSGKVLAKAGAKAGKRGDLRDL